MTGFTKKHSALTALILILILVGLLYLATPKEQTTKPEPTAKQTLADSDNDGLTDEEELQLGTDPKKPDTDNDGLTDFQEVRTYKTDPKNPNTDGDRHLDGEEVRRGSNPLVVNTARIEVSKQNIKGDYNIINIVKLGAVSAGLTACGALSVGACAAAIPGVAAALSTMLDDVLYESQVTFTIKNNGDDHTSYLRYDIVYKLGSETLGSHNEVMGRIDSGQTYTKPYTHQIKVRDIPASLWNLVMQRGNIGIEVENLDYERFG